MLGRVFVRTIHRDLQREFVVGGLVMKKKKNVAVSNLTLRCVSNAVGACLEEKSKELRPVRSGACQCWSAL